MRTEQAVPVRLAPNIDRRDWLVETVDLDVSLDFRPARSSRARLRLNPIL